MKFNMFTIYVLETWNRIQQTLSVLVIFTNLYCSPVKNVTRIFSCPFEGSLVWFENETKSDGNPIIFLANAMEIPCHVPAWKTNKTWINEMELSWNLVWIWTKLPSICDMWYDRTWNFHENPCRIFYRVIIIWHNNPCKK